MAEETKLLFAYDALLDPDTLSGVAPGAEFLLVAHYPETRLGFVSVPDGGVHPTLIRDPGHTVWGAVFSVPATELDALVALAEADGRSTGYDDQRAVDREGNKHDCVVLVAEGDPASPDPGYVAAMIRGARHWNLPAGWVIGLEDLVDDPLFT
ncbi:MAG TPA: gamma-glutamylcyclotransferase family protein [Acidimicrobiia bacterium]